MFFSFPKALKHSRLVCSDLRKLHDWGYQDLPMCLLARNKQHYSKTWANIICETCLVEFPSLWTGFYFEALHHWQDLAECLTQSLIDVTLAHPQYGVQFVKTYFSMLLYVYRYLYWLVTCSGSWLLSFNQHVPHCLQLTYQQFWKSMLSSMVRAWSIKLVDVPYTGSMLNIPTGNSTKLMQCFWWVGMYPYQK